jgi:hypothetical protein
MNEKSNVLFITLDHKVETSKYCEKYILNMLINYCFMKGNVISFLSWNDENNLSSFVILEILFKSNKLWLLSSFFYSEIKSRRPNKRIRIRRTNFILYIYRGSYDIRLRTLNIE